MNNMTSDRFIDILFKGALIGCLLVLLIISFDSLIYCSDVEVKKEIIRNSDEYVIFNECTEIENKYYCK